MVADKRPANGRRRHANIQGFKILQWPCLPIRRGFGYHTSQLLTTRLARAATKLMMRKRFGRIIAITSIVGVTGNPGQANYTASKAGLIGLIKTLGGEYAKRNVTANCIAPGFIKTPMTDALNDKQRETILTKVPAARLGTPEDIAAAAVYLSSNEAAYVTGQTIHVNGGMAMF